MEKAITEFKKLIETYPNSVWVIGAHYHIGLSYKQLKDVKKAREEFQYVINHFPTDENMVNLSKAQLKEIKK